MLFKNILLLIALCIGIILPASGKHEENVVDFLKSTMWKLDEYTQRPLPPGEGVESNEVEKTVKVGADNNGITDDIFTTFTDTEMIVVYYYKDEEGTNTDVRVYQYYLSDSWEEYFEPEKVGKTKNGSYLIMGTGKHSWEAYEYIYHVEVYKISKTPDNRLSVEDFMGTDTPGLSLSYMKPCSEEETKLANRIYLNQETM